MTLSVNDVKRIAELAYIEINDQEAIETLGQLSGIFNLIESMQVVDTETVEPMSHAQNVFQRLREDEITETDQHQLYQSIAPQVEADLYLVPQVIE